MRSSSAVRTIHLRRRVIVLAVVLLGLLSFIVLVGATPLLLLVKPDLIVIELERTGCYGICPIYSLRIQGDGQVKTSHDNANSVHFARNVLSSTATCKQPTSAIISLDNSAIAPIYTWSLASDRELEKHHPKHDL